MRFETGVATHTGLVRALNEDAYLVGPSLHAVADGMGGHACGDVASAIAVRELERVSEKPAFDPADVVTAIEQANAAILAEAAAHPEKEGMGTTLAGVAVVEHAGSPHWLVFNVGDSRVYRIGATPEQLTVDHSEVAELVAAGQLTAADARTHPLRHVITRSIGSPQVGPVDTWLIPICDGDLLLVCSDGLTGEVEETEIGRLVSTSPDLSTAAEALIRAALDGGGHDNVTAVLVRAFGSSGDDELVGRTQPRPDVRTTGR